MSKRASYKSLKSVLELLRYKALTREEIMTASGIGKTMVIMALKELREAREIYICDYLMNDSRKTPIYKAGNKPDAIYERKIKGSTAGIRRKKIEPEYVVPKTIIHPFLIEWVFRINKNEHYKSQSTEASSI